MYNPNSVAMAMKRKELDSYWRNTSSFESINTFITMNYAGLKDDIMTMLSGGMVRVNTNTFQNDLSSIASRDDVLTALIHLGYLGYDADRKKAYVPNYEVATVYEAALQTGDWTEIAKAISICDELLDETIEGNAGYRPAMIVELKCNKSADTAIKQIKEKRYQGALTGYQGKILLVGINYDAEGKEKKHHTCVIEEWQ